MSEQAEAYAARIFKVDGDNIVIQTSMLNEALEIMALLVITPFFVYLTYLYPETTTYRIYFSESASVACPLLVIFPLAVLAAIIHKKFNARLVVCKDYVLFITGLLSWREKTLRLEHHRIQEIEIDQTIIQRILGIGDVIITPAVTSFDAFMRVPGVRSPRIVKDLLRARGALDHAAQPMQNVVAHNPTSAH